MIFKYLSYVIRHKWYVYLACCERGIWWLGLIHDLSKFRWSEFMPYARHFYGKKVVFKVPIDTGKHIVGYFKAKEVEKNCYNCAHVVGSQCEPTYSSIGNGEQAPDCPDYKFSEESDSTGYYKPTDTGDPAFDFAWLLHQKRNKHHWQWWILPQDQGGNKVLPMPTKYRMEMLCDWLGANKAQGHAGTMESLLEWWKENESKIQLHEETRLWIEAMFAMDLEEAC